MHTARHHHILLVLLTIHAILLGWSAFTHSPTRNEPEYLAAGISHWQHRHFNLAKISPPLVRLVAAIPVMLASPETDYRNDISGPGFRMGASVGNDFLIANGRRVFWLFTIARWMCIPFSLIGAYVCYAWSLRLWGIRSAFVATTLWCFCPNILGHGALMTADVGVTALGVAACYRFWIWFRSRTAANACFAGLVLGAAILAKSNALVLLGVLPSIGCALFLLRKDRSDSIFNLVFQQALIVIVSIYVINLGYGFDGSFERLDSYKFVSRSFTSLDHGNIGNRFTGSFLGCIPLPLPASFVEGLDLQRFDFENPSGYIRTYFRGQWFHRSFWLYYPYVVAVKVPLGIWILLFGAAIVQIECAGFRGLLDANLLLLIVPGMALFFLACSQLGFGYGLRYVLPAFPYAFIFASGIVRGNLTNRAISATTMLLLAFAAVSSLLVYPHSLAYFNEAAGGPRNGYFHLQNGNLDCHQDLLYLEEWFERHPDCKPMEAFLWSKFPLRRIEAGRPEIFTTIGPLEQVREGKNIPPGWYAVSSHALCENEDLHKAFFNLEPAAHVGYSVNIYHKQ